MIKKLFILLFFASTFSIIYAQPGRKPLPQSANASATIPYDVSGSINLRIDLSSNTATEQLNINRLAESSYRVVGQQDEHGSLLNNNCIS